jgi:hypothetical protein
MAALVGTARSMARLVAYMTAPMILRSEGLACTGPLANWIGLTAVQVRYAVAQPAIAARVGHRLAVLHFSVEHIVDRIRGIGFTLHFVSSVWLHMKGALVEAGSYCRSNERQSKGFSTQQWTSLSRLAGAVKRLGDKGVLAVRPSTL